jgi:radical SAM protein with 4Fe4S-binding SPASM domain
MKKSVYDFSKTWNEKSIAEFLSHKFPKFELDLIGFHLGSTCPLSCPWCYGKNLKQKDLSVIPFKAYKENVFDHIKRSPLIEISGLYSEPLTYPEFNEFITEVGNKGLRFGLYTNALLLTKEMAKLLCDVSLKNEGMPSYISFDVSAIVHIYGLRWLTKKLKWFNRPHNLQLNTPILLTDEITRPEWLEELLKRNGSSAVRYAIPQEPLSVAHRKMYELLKDRKDVYWQPPFRTHNRCFIMTNSMTINHDGRVYPCSQVATEHFKHLSFGDITKESIVQIWHNTKHKKLFNKFNPQNEVCRCNNTEVKFNTLCSRYYK